MNLTRKKINISLDVANEWIHAASLTRKKINISLDVANEWIHSTTCEGRDGRSPKCMHATNGGI